MGLCGVVGENLSDDEVGIPFKYEKRMCEVEYGYG